MIERRTNKLKKLSQLFFLCFLVGMLSFDQKGYSQENTLDSLKLIVNNKSIKDTARISALVKLSEFYMDINITKATLYAENARDISRTSNNPDYSALTYATLARNLVDNVQLCYNTMDSAQLYLAHSTDILIKTKVLLKFASIKNLWDDPDYQELLFEALYLAKSVDNKELLANVYLDLSEYYLRKAHDFDNYKEYAKLFIQVSENINSRETLMNHWENKGKLYYYQAKHNTHSDSVITNPIIDSSLICFKKAVNIYNHNVSAINAKHYLRTLDFISRAYQTKRYEDFVLDELHYLYPDSLRKYSYLLLEEAERLGDIEYQAEAYLTLFGLDTDVKDFKRAEETLSKAMGLIENINGHYKLKASLANMYVFLYEIQGDYEKALEYSYLVTNSFIKEYDTKYIKQRQISEVKYRLKEKEEKLILAEERALQQRKLLLLFGVSAVLLVGILVILYQLRLKTMTQKQILLDKEKEEANLLAQLKEEEAGLLEMKKFAVELEKELEKERADRKALEVNRLQKELIIGTTQLDKKNNTLEEINNRLNSENTLLDKNEISNLLKVERRSDGRFEDFADILKNIHPDFYTLLQEKAIQKLTPLDLKYCAYIYMRLSTKEIASLIFVQPRTVRVTKYRLKLKLDLDKNDDLELFIQQIIDKK